MAEVVSAIDESSHSPGISVKSPSAIPYGREPSPAPRPPKPAEWDVMTAPEEGDNVTDARATSLVVTLPKSPSKSKSKSTSPSKTTTFASFLPAWYRPPWDDSGPTWDGIYANPRNPDSPKELWRWPEKKGPRDCTNLPPIKLKELLSRSLQRIRYARLRAERATRVVERGIAQAEKVSNREQRIVADCSHHLQVTRQEDVMLAREEVDVLFKLDELGAAASEAIKMLGYHHRLLVNELEQCATCEGVLAAHWEAVGEHERWLAGRRSRTSINTLDYLEMHRSGHLASALADGVRQTSQAAVAAAEHHTANCASARLQISSALTEIASSPHRLAVQTRVRLWQMGLDGLLYDLGASGLDDESPSGLLKGRYHFDCDFNFSSLSLHRPGDPPVDDSEEHIAEGTRMMQGERAAGAELADEGSGEAIADVVPGRDGPADAIESPVTRYELIPE